MRKARLRVAVTGAAGVIGRSAVHALVADGHDVVGLSGTADDQAGLVRMFEGCDAVFNLGTHPPVGYRAGLPGAWREHDRLCTEGVRRVVAAARQAGVRRLVQESVSFIYADHGDDWITEQSPVEINRATEPASVGESHVQDYACHSRTGVVLRLGAILGNDDLTRWWLRSAWGGRTAGAGRPGSWAHVLHPDDLGTAMVAALKVPGGVYNVGAEPVRRAEITRVLADATRREAVDVVGAVLRKVAGTRMEPMTRSLRVSSGHFAAQTGWAPRHASFDASWFDAADAGSRAVR